jgi:tRNA-dihydrouridine synthase B
MNPVAQFDGLLAGPQPLLALAPMQDVTDLPFWTLLSQYGGPDIYWTEYIRVHSTNLTDRAVVRSIVENPTGRPAVVQLIGNDIDALTRAAHELEHLPVAAIDLNLGCPAPVVYRKCAGGGLLREPARIDAILGALRAAITRVRFTVKTRIGFDSPRHFDQLLNIFARHSPDALTVHGRTVLEMYRTEVHHDRIAQAVRQMPCPVIANGNASSAAQAERILDLTGARGLMIGRGCIRNPWIFDQIRSHRLGLPVPLPVGRDVLTYIHRLYESTQPTAHFSERLQVEKMKKYMNFVGDGIGPDFLHQIRRALTREEFFRICTGFLDHDQPMPLLPHSRLEPVSEGSAAAPEPIP